MKNAIILHGTDFAKDQKQSQGNWFPWLKGRLQDEGYNVWLEELPEAWHPDLGRYWNVLKDFDYNEETLLIGHSSGAATVFGILHKLPDNIIVNHAISVAGFYKDGGWGCEGLFSEELDWDKIKGQARSISVLWSPDDPYISKEQTEGLSIRLDVEPIIIENQKHFSVGSVGEKYRQFPELLDLILNNVDIRNMLC